VDVASQGSVIFLLLTDIIGSTRLSRAFPREYLEAEVVHDGLVSDAIAKHGGAVHLRTGDGYWAVFGSAYSAVLAARQIQAEVAANRPRLSFPDGRFLEVRCLIGGGAATQKPDGTWEGEPFRELARTESALDINPGQIVMTQFVHEVLRASPPAGVGFERLGNFKIEDWPRAVTLFQVESPVGTTRKFVKLVSKRGRLSRWLLAAAALTLLLGFGVGWTLLHKRPPASLTGRIQARIVGALKSHPAKAFVAVQPDSDLQPLGEDMVRVLREAKWTIVDDKVHVRQGRQQRQRQGIFVRLVKPANEDAPELASANALRGALDSAGFLCVVEYGDVPAGQLNVEIHSKPAKGTQQHVEGPAPPSSPPQPDSGMSAPQQGRSKGPSGQRQPPRKRPASQAGP
jgi:class 3 adenylate cyclase